MDPFTFAAICVVAFGMVGGFDAASGGVVRAEVGGGVRGAGRALGGAGFRRWQQSRNAARAIRMQSPLGWIVQGYLDAFGGAVRVAVRGWRSGRVRAKRARQARMAGEPWPIVRICGPLVDRAKARAERWAGSGSGHPNGTPNWAEPNDPNEPAFGPNAGCLEVLGWPERNGERWPVYCGEPCEPGWRICPTHKAERLADPDYPSEDIDELRADPDAPISPDAYRSGPDPNGDPNVPHDSHLPDQNGDVKCGCCAQLHKPTPRGEHCPNCHLHDGPTTQNAPAPTGPMRGTTVPDINSAPAAIAAAEAFRGRLEEPESLLASLRDEITSTLDGMGDFAIGGEGDTSGRFGVVVDAVTSAKEGLDVYLADLHREYDASIEAASSKQAAAHAPMQEV